KARDALTAIAGPDRVGDLAVVPYQLADLLLRLAPRSADDAITAGKLEEALKGSIELLDGFVGGNPQSPLAPAALLKLGHCHPRLAALLATPPEQQKALATARAVYERIQQQFPRSEARPVAVFERAKVIAAQKDVNTAMNELRRFTNDPTLKGTPVAPMA